VVCAANGRVLVSIGNPDVGHSGIIQLLVDTRQSPVN
jgi:hypothetical protein